MDLYGPQIPFLESQVTIDRTITKSFKVLVSNYFAMDHITFAWEPDNLLLWFQGSCRVLEHCADSGNGSRGIWL